MSRRQSNLLEKTELRIEGISLQDANLNEIASTVAHTLGMEQSEVLVTDVQDHHLTIDILRQTVDPRLVVGRKDELLKSLGSLPGVNITEETSIHSNGMLGWISLDGDEGTEALGRSERMVEKIRLNLSKRAVVFSTGHEVATGQIKDTNTPTIAETLEAAGYVVKRGPTLKDDKPHQPGQDEQAKGCQQADTCHDQQDERASIFTGTRFHRLPNLPAKTRESSQMEEEAASLREKSVIW